MDLRAKIVDGLSFNSKSSTIMHIDINSCFASVEQQANPLLRDKPVAVAAYNSPNGCILSPSVQAKKFGVKVGMRVKDGQKLCPGLIILASDPDKYRSVHLALRDLLSVYTPDINPKSIDEFVLDFTSVPNLRDNLFAVAVEIKDRIKKEIGDYLTVSIGLAPNRFLAKTASNLHKPDGLDEINQYNFSEIYQSLTLMDLHGINTQNTLRLNMAGIQTVSELYAADSHYLRRAFRSILGLHWYLRLRGWEVDGEAWQTKSFGHSYSPPKALVTPTELAPILSKLVEKVGARMRHSGFQAKGIHLALTYRNRTYWQRSLTLGQPISSSQDIYYIAHRLLLRSPGMVPVRNIAISCFSLGSSQTMQLNLFKDSLKQEKLTQAIDEVNDRWGAFVVSPGTMIKAAGLVPESIGFGNIRGLA